MKIHRLYPTVIALLSFYATSLHAQAYQWVNTMGNTGTDRGNATAFDPSGNVYVTGYFSGTVDFDPGPNVASLTATGTTDAFIAKYSSTGAYLWAERLGGTGENAGNSIAADPNGNVFIGGYFSGTADLDPGNGTVSATSAGYTDGFILKLDNNGNHLWSLPISGPYVDRVDNVVIDAAGNHYASGIFSGTPDFNPGTLTTTLDASNGILFMAKYANTGAYLWAKNTAATSGSFSVNAMSLDKNGNIYLTGAFNGSIDFAPGPTTATRTSTGLQDIYLAKYDNAGNYKWVNTMGSISNVNTPRGVTVDGSGNVSITGNFYNTVDFDAGSATANLTSSGNYNIFIAQYDSLGKYKWAKGLDAVNGSSTNQGTAICADRDGNLYIAGHYSLTVDFDPSPGTANQTARLVDAFIAKYDKTGAYKWARSFSTAHAVLPGNAMDTHFAMDEQNNVCITGSFVDTTDFAPGSPGASRVSAGSHDIYVTKYAVAQTGIRNTPSGEPAFVVYPNPTRQAATLSYELDAAAAVSILVCDIQGRKVAEPFHASQGAGKHTFVLDAGRYGLAPGVYMISLRAGNEAVTRRLVIGQ